MCVTSCTVQRCDLCTPNIVNCFETTKLNVIGCLLAHNARSILISSTASPAVLCPAAHRRSAGTNTAAASRRAFRLVRPRSPPTNTHPLPKWSNTRRHPPQPPPTTKLSSSPSSMQALSNSAPSLSSPASNRPSTLIYASPFPIPPCSNPSQPPCQMQSNRFPTPSSAASRTPRCPSPPP